MGEGQAVRWVPFMLVAVLAVLVQATVLRLAAVGDAFPDLLVALVVTFGLGVGPAQGFAAGAVLGLGRDLFTIGPLGLGTAASALLGWAASRQRPAAFAGHFLTRAMFAFAASVVMSLVLAAGEAAGGGSLGAGLVLRRTALTALSAAALAAVVGGLVWRKAKWFGLRGRSEFADV
mgnify:CR=1 FL=1